MRDARVTTMTEQPAGNALLEAFTAGAREVAGTGEDGAACIAIGPRPLRTAHHCAFLGASLYAASFLVALLAVWLADRRLPGGEQTFSAHRILVVLAGVLPPFFMIGAGSGFRLYRTIGGGAQHRPAGTGEAVYQFVLMFSLANLGVILFLLITSKSSGPLPALLTCSWLFLLWHRRHRTALAFWFPMWVLALAVYPLGDLPGFGGAGTGLLACALAVLLAADALLLNTICRWQKNGNLAPSPAYTFQFSLGSLMALVLGIATYFSILVLLAGP